MRLINRPVTCLLALCLSACTVVQEASNIYKMGTNAFEISNEELRELAQQPLPANFGVSYDLALSRRALAEMLLADSQAIQITKRIAIENASQENTIISIMNSVALVEQTTGNPRQARIEFQDIEKRLQLDKETPLTIFNESQNSSFLINYLSFAAGMMDWDLGDRLLDSYFDPAQNNSSIDLEIRFGLLVAADDYRFRKQATMGDPHGAYIARLTALDSYRTGPLKQIGKSSRVQDMWKFRESLFRQMAGVDAVNAGQIGQAVEQLNIIKSLWDGDDPTISMNIFELEQLLHWYRGDYQAALKNMHAYTQEYPLMVNRIPAVKNIFLMGEAQYLTGLGEWNEAYRILNGMQEESVSRLIEEYRVGYLTLSEAKLGQRPSMLEEFANAEPRFRQQRRGIQAGIGYYGISTTVFGLLADKNGNASDLKRAISSGRQFGESLRENKYYDRNPTSPLPKLVMDAAKEAYANAVIQGIDQRLSNEDDLVDAVQILQMSETDRDIAAMTMRLSNVANIKSAELRELQNLQRHVWATQNKLVSVSMASNANSAENQTIYREAQAASQAYNSLLNEISQRQPLINQLLTSPKAIKSHDIQEHLSAGEALLAITPFSNSTLILLIDRDKVKYKLVGVGKSEIDALVKRVRQTIEFKGDHSLLDFDTDAAYTLYDILLGWNDSSLKEIKHLHVTTTGSLASLPFSLLLRKPIDASVDAYGRADWLIKSVAISETPTINAWHSLRQSKRTKSSEGFIAWALPLTGVGGALDTLIEANSIADALGAPRTDVISGSNATRDDVLTRSSNGELERKNIVMFATHGFAPGELPDLTQPALNMKPENGREVLLTLEDVMRLRLSADWVILSACNTDAADRIGGAPFSGLARGFFFSGARGLLLTHWSVDSKSATKITTKTMKEYAAHPQEGHAEALRKVSLSFINGDEIPEIEVNKRLWQHPAYWAPFSVVGGL